MGMTLWSAQHYKTSLFSDLCFSTCTSIQLIFSEPQTCSFYPCNFFQPFVLLSFCYFIFSPYYCKSPVGLFFLWSLWPILPTDLHNIGRLITLKHTLCSKKPFTSSPLTIPLPLSPKSAVIKVLYDLNLVYLSKFIPPYSYLSNQSFNHIQLLIA